MSLRPSGIGVVEVVEERLATALGVRQDASEVAAAIRKYPGEELEQISWTRSARWRSGTQRARRSRNASSKRCFTW